jgi:hypothetical protein
MLAFVMFALDSPQQGNNDVFVDVAIASKIRIEVFLATLQIE